MPSNQGDGHTQHQRDLWTALDLTAHALANHIVDAHEDTLSVLGVAVRHLETAKIIALEGLGYAEADRLALERVGTSNEQVKRWARQFLENWANRLSRDHYESADAESLAELWGHATGRIPRTQADLDELVRELREIIERSPDDPEYQQLLGFAPGGSAKEVREILSRWRGR